MRPHLTTMSWFVILTIITIGLALGLPPDPHAVQQLHTSEVAYRTAIAALLVPYILIWYASFYAFAKLQEYSRPLKDTEDGEAFNKITVGMGTLAFSFVIPTIISLILNNIALHNPTFKPTAIITENYLGLFPGLVAFLFLYNGARMLLRTVRGGAKKLDIRWHAPWFFLLCISFSHLAIENQYRYHSYHLRVWLLVITFIVPYLYGWMVGLLSAFELHWYAKTVKGLLYKKAVRQFAKGIAVVVTGSIAMQFVDVTFGQRISSSLGRVLLVDYILLIIVAIGLVLMALGTKKLKLIEEL